MKRNLIILGVCVAVLAGVGAGYYFGYDHGFERSTQQTTTETSTDFNKSGKLVRNSPHGSEAWHIEYQEDGQTKQERLGFEMDAICTNQQGSDDRPAINYCSNYELRPNDSIQVTGERMKDYIRVTSLAITLAAPKPTSTDTFKETKEYGYYGTLTLKGYLKTERRVCNPGDMCGETVDYSFFVFTETDNEAIKKMVGPGDYTGNAFLGEYQVGIGCLEKSKSRIFYQNDADSGYIEGEIKGSDYNKLLASSANNQVQLKLTREIYTSGRGAPDCYAHFRNFDVL